MAEKYYNSDRTAVGVLISPRYGVPMGDEERFDPFLIAQYDTTQSDYERITEYLERHYMWPDYMLDDVADLELEWVPVGEEFIVEDYDGAEAVRYKSCIHWFKA